MLLAGRSDGESETDAQHSDARAATAASDDNDRDDDTHADDDNAESYDDLDEEQGGRTDVLSP